MSGKAIRSSYTIDGLLGLNRQDEHKHQAKPERVIDQATHKPDHSTRHDTEQGIVSLPLYVYWNGWRLQHRNILQISWEVNRADDTFSHAKILF